jgi:hypothetical protein
VNRLNKLSVRQVSLLQSVGLITYVILVGTLIYNAPRIFGPMNTFMGPVLFLTLFVSSALICAIISLAYPIWVFLEKKDLPAHAATKKAVSVVIYEALFMVLFSIVLLLLLVIT